MCGRTRSSLGDGRHGLFGNDRGKYPERKEVDYKEEGKTRGVALAAQRQIQR